LLWTKLKGGVLMKVLISLYRAAGELPVAQKNIEVVDVGQLKVHELLDLIKVNDSEVYAEDTLEITFKNFS
jgi:hypothetical protein